MYCYCIEKSEIRKRSANKNGSHFENFWGCLQVFVLWELVGMTTAANVDLMESLLDNWLKNNHINIDKIYYLRRLFVFFYKF